MARKSRKSKAVATRSAGVSELELDLPVLRPRETGGCGKIRPSRRGRWRALTLILLHVAILIHVVQWWVTGTTLTPVEPSEAIQTLGEGLVNAGFVLFAVAILATLIFGRFFCGWGCHIVALQDLCSWLLKRVGIRPRPFRSRVLVWVPLAGALWMFVAPTLTRLWTGAPRPEFQAHFMTEDFWDRFPGPFVALLTFFVCGFLIVYLLGNKGFCTYGCPYGGIFGLADQVAPGKIRVTDACEGCAHCTATCTSNVRVHEEVRTHGMVVNPGCMKCMDCIDVCPKNALYFGFGKTTANKGKPRHERKRPTYDFSWGEEIALGAAFLVSVVVLRALYGAVPFLLALGLSAISAYVLLTAARMFYVRDVRFARYRLRMAGRNTGAGSIYLVSAVVWTVFLIHSAAVQYLTADGQREVKRALSTYWGSGNTMTAAASEELRRGVESLEWAEALGLTAPANLLVLIASGHSHLGHHQVATTYYRRAVEAEPRFASARYEYARYLAAAGQRDEAIEHLVRVVERKPDLPGAAGVLSGLLLESGRVKEARTLLEEQRLRRPQDVEIRLAHGVVLAQLGQMDQALAETRAALAENTKNPHAHFNLGQILAKSRQFESSLAALEGVIELDPSHVEGRRLYAKVAAQLKDWDGVLEQFDWLRSRDPFNAEYVGGWALTLAKAGGLTEAIAEAEAVRDRDRSARFRLVYLYQAAGREDEAQALAPEFAK